MKPPEPITLREVIDSDLSLFFEFQLDSTANHMAAFTAKDPADRDAFDAHWERILGDEKIVIQTILFEEQVAGHIATFERSGEQEITYWIGRPYWGKGVATAALKQFLIQVTERPLHARVAKDNIGSRRVLEKCGFIAMGEESGFAQARGEEIPECLMMLQT